MTGIFTYRDWQILKNSYNQILKSLPDNLKEDLYPDYFLTKGQKGKDIRRLQRLLLSICRYNHSIPGIRVNGIFDDLTEMSIKKIQKDYGFDINGIVGPLLWKKLVELSKRT